MRSLVVIGVTLLAFGPACSPAASVGRAPAKNVSASAPALASIMQQDSLVAVREPGPHAGGGETTAYPFFADAPHFALVFRKRALHRGAAIGYHLQETDEVYYVLSGRGELTLDGARREVGPGTAILTRSGSSHGLRQLGNEDLVIIVSYQQTAGR